ncbi:MULTISPECIES: TonB-dependent receptor domain-containing protein [unclassified Campylobacter]|uniref:TonB-dependent receptor domain-containing protein n=1 Tax=unclassified Campylobacter TaxID=2593542 RepID=UPI0022E99C3D|nr:MULTISPECIES: TonB-dependent receptor [unclassified Campylobacter]MDA3042971.1 TonB-dependent receptor [Campylobacter sp. JMF_09 ED2]MDA3044194.1 TonB-dependent receptor [Campylobacter sp. JMF_07 ED4]MDA3063543.1 TonB-dependent receptor [Campylobacter sp. JMF_11 EL3]MDA3071169.1 TonB-dependent receptor [Campylobacter sp. VBCF_03 NA9]MDA3074629.1 TonB-dependent receptor [Campylobacter sp. JMF_05 ED3]
MKKSFYLSIVVAGVLFGVENNATTPKHNAVEFDEIIVSATLTEVENLKYPGSVGVLTPNDFKSKPNIVDALREIPGVDGGLDTGRQAAKTIYIRGFSDDERIIIKQDGVSRSKGLFSGMISTLRTDTDLLKKAEVVKGASSILHGSGAIGGVISMETKSAKDFLREGKEIGAMIGGRIESNNMKGARGAVYANPTDIPIDILLYGKFETFGDNKFADGGRWSDSYKEVVKKDKNDEDITTLFAKIGSDFGDSHRVQFSAYDYKEDTRIPWQARSNVYQNLNGIVNPVTGEILQRDFIFDYTYNPAHLDYVNLAFKAYDSKSHYDRYYLEGAGQDLSYKNEDDRYGFSLKNEAFFKTGFIDHDLVVGAEYQHRKENAIYIYDGVKSEFGGMPNTQKTYAAFLQDIMKMGNFELTLGGRYDKFKSHAPYADTDDSRFSPRVALGVELFEGFNLLAGYAEAFRAPTPNEASQMGAMNRMYYYVPNFNLEPETAKEWEVGFSYEKSEIIGNDYLNFKAIYFDGKIDNMIALKARPDLGTPPPNRLNDWGASDFQQYAQYQNVDKAKRYGVEISANYAIGDFKFGASYENSKIYDTQTREDLKQLASKLTGSIGYSPITDLDLKLKVSHYFDPKSNPSSFISGRTEYFYVDKPFTIVDFSGSYEIKNGVVDLLDGAKVGFGVNNLFDKPYMNAAVNRDSYLVGKGRNFWVDLEVKF